MAAYSNRDLSLVPNVSFSLIVEFFKSHTGASGNKSISKGFKYFSEGYVHDLKGMLLFIYDYTSIHSCTFPSVEHLYLLNYNSSSNV